MTGSNARAPDGCGLWGLLIPIAAIAVVLNVLLLLSGYRILIGERIVRPGENYVVGEWGQLGKNGQASIVCNYWTGRNSKPIVWWYGNGFMSRDECPFLHNPNKSS